MVTVTVAIAAWNSSTTIAECIRSALDQIDITSQVLVVDDGSFDNTVEIAEKCGARVIRLSDNGGPGRARNVALDAASTDWLAVLDSDDQMEPWRLRDMLKIAQEHDADVVLGNLSRVDEDGRPIDGLPFVNGPDYDEPIPLDLDTYIVRNHDPHRRGALGYLKPLLRVDFCNKNGIRYPTETYNGEDYHLMLSCLAADARVIFSPAPDYIYTSRRGSISHRVDPSHIEPLIQADRAFVAQHASRLSNLARKVFADRQVMLDRTRYTEIVLQSLKRGNLRAAVSALAQRPSAIGMIGAKFLEAGSKRLLSKGCANRRTPRPSGEFTITQRGGGSLLKGSSGGGTHSSSTSTERDDSGTSAPR